MKTYQIIYLIMFLLFPKKSFCQDIYIKDLDGDKISDTISYQRQNSLISCKLSSQNFKEIKTQKIDFLDPETSGIELTKSGFKFYSYHMRAGYTCQFRYSTKSKKIQLIGMDRYNYGGATHDGSGESSINLFSNIYIGNWNYFDTKKSILVKIPTIKAKYFFPKTDLENFSEKQPEKYADDCYNFYLKQRNKY